MDQQKAPTQNKAESDFQYTTVMNHTIVAVNIASNGRWEVIDNVLGNYHLSCLFLLLFLFHRVSGTIFSLNVNQLTRTLSHDKKDISYRDIPQSQPTKI